MSKELKALEKICSKGCDYCDAWHYENNLRCKYELGGCSKCIFCGEEHDIIETALEDYEDLKERMDITDVVKEDFIKLWKEHKALKTLKAFGFEIEDYTENEHGSIKVKCNRIIVDDEEIDIAKEVLKNE